MLDALMQGPDRDAVKVWEKQNLHRFDRVMLKTKTVAVEVKDEGLEVKFEGEGVSPEPVMYDMILQAAGRSPNGGKIAADKAGVIVTDRSFITVAVSYTHLDVYKRQAQILRRFSRCCIGFCT